MKINHPSTCPPRVALPVLSFIARIDTAHLSTLPLSEIVTASLSQWTSILQAESCQWVLHIYVPPYLEKWVTRADERSTKDGAAFWSARSGDPCGTGSALGGVGCQRFRNGAPHLSRGRGAGIPSVSRATSGLLSGESLAAVIFGSPNSS